MARPAWCIPLNPEYPSGAQHAREPGEMHARMVALPIQGSTVFAVVMRRSPLRWNDPIFRSSACTGSGVALTKSTWRP